MRAGSLRHKITIQETTETRDTVGSVINTWSTFLVARAEINPRIGKEYFDSDRLNADNTVLFRIRYRSGILTKQRISWDSRVFDITSLINLRERNREILIMCEEVV